VALAPAFIDAACDHVFGEVNDLDAGALLAHTVSRRGMGLER